MLLLLLLLLLLLADKLLNECPNSITRHVLPALPEENLELVTRHQVQLCIKRYSQWNTVAMRNVTPAKAMCMCKINRNLQGKSCTKVAGRQREQHPWLPKALVTIQVPNTKRGLKQVAV